MLSNLTTEQLSERLYQVNMNSSERRDLAASLQAFGLERDRMRTALARRAGVSQSDLDALEHLEAAGLVRRRPHPADRRYVVLELTAQAIRHAPAGLAAYHAAVADLVARVPSEHSDVIASFLRAVAHPPPGRRVQWQPDRDGATVAELHIL